MSRGACREGLKNFRVNAFFRSDYNSKLTRIQMFPDDDLRFDRAKSFVFGIDGALGGTQILLLARGFAVYVDRGHFEV